MTNETHFPATEVETPPSGLDFITYSGVINTPGYHTLCSVLEEKGRGDECVLALATAGGDAHAGFRIARALQHRYEQFELLVPRYCKSAGTLIALGAKLLYLDDMSELGPLDVQIRKGDEVVGRNSGLEIFQAVEYLRDLSLKAFQAHLRQLTSETGLSTRVASQIAVDLTRSLLTPIAEQIDPLKLAEMNRATQIAMEYGYRLNERSENLLPHGLERLVTQYPSHGFVIDRKEARSIFKNVHRPEGVVAQLSRQLRDEMIADINAENPVVNVISASKTQDDSDVN